MGPGTCSFTGMGDTVPDLHRVMLWSWYLHRAGGCYLHWYRDRGPGTSTGTGPSTRPCTGTGGTVWYRTCTGLGGLVPAPALEWGARYQTGTGAGDPVPVPAPGRGLVPAVLLGRGTRYRTRSGTMLWSWHREGVWSRSRSLLGAFPQARQPGSSLSPAHPRSGAGAEPPRNNGVLHPQQGRSRLPGRTLLLSPVGPVPEQNRGWRPHRDLCWHREQGPVVLPV